MNDKLKYDPEDIESLLMHKQFNELYDEEKQFVLQYVDGEAEYESLRKTMFELHDAGRAGEWLEPDPSMKDELLALFANEKKGRFKIWLNSLFATPEITWYRRPAFALTLATACIAGLIVFIVNYRDTESIHEFAEVVIPQEPVDSAATAEQLFAENLAVKTYPPAPVPVESPAVEVPSEQYLQLDENMDAAAAGVAETDDVESLSKSESEKNMAPSSVNSKNLSDNTIAKDQTKKPQTSTAAAIEDQIPVEQTEVKSVTLSDAVVREEAVSITSGSATYTSPTIAHLSIENEFAWTAPPPATSRSASEIKDVFNVLYTAK